MEIKQIAKAILLLIIVVSFFLAGRYSITLNSVGGVSNLTNISDIVKNCNTEYNTGYNVAWDKATKLVDSSIVRIFPAQGEMLSINGVIKTVASSGDSLTIEANPVSSNPLSADSKTTARTIKVTLLTKIIKMTAKTLEEIQAATSKANQPIMPFKEEEITFSQLKAGDNVSVESDKNIKNAMEITASKITLQ